MRQSTLKMESHLLAPRPSLHNMEAFLLLLVSRKYSTPTVTHLRSQPFHSSSLVDFLTRNWKLQQKKKRKASWEAHSPTCASPSLTAVLPLPVEQEVFSLTWGSQGLDWYILHKELICNTDPVLNYPVVFFPVFTPQGWLEKPLDLYIVCPLQGITSKPILPNATALSALHLLLSVPQS